MKNPVSMELIECLQLETPALMKALCERFPSAVTDGDNYLLYVPDNPVPLLLVAHIDVVGTDSCPSVQIIGQGRVLASTGVSVLGADDRAGVYAILRILDELARRNQPPPMVLFTNYEERGGRGVRRAIEDRVLDPYLSNINMFLEVDREGVGEAVTYSGDLPTAAKEYLREFGWSLGHGTYSDIAGLIGEYGIAGANVSAGYYRQHTQNEYLVLDALELTINRMLGMCQAPPQTQFKQEVRRSTWDWGGYDSPAWADTDSYKPSTERDRREFVDWCDEVLDEITTDGYCPFCRQAWTHCTCGEIVEQLLDRLCCGDEINMFLDTLIVPDDPVYDELVEAWGSRQEALDEEVPEVFIGGGEWVHDALNKHAI